MRYLTRKSPGIIVSEHPDDNPWKLDVGDECNTLLDHADAVEQWGLRTEDELKAKQDSELAKTLRSIVERVASFEELEAE